MWNLLPVVYLAVVSVPLTVIDLREHRLPNLWVMPGYLVVTAAVMGQWSSQGEFPWLVLWGGAGYFLFLLVLSFTGGMGMGDVKLAGVLGATSGMLGLEAVVLSLLFAFVLGGVVSLILLLLRRGNRRTRIPFGPFLLAGFCIAASVTLFIE